MKANNCILLVFSGIVFWRVNFSKFNDVYTGTRIDVCTNDDVINLNMSVEVSLVICIINYVNGSVCGDGDKNDFVRSLIYYRINILIRT